MATNWINVKGTIEWAQIYTPDEYAGDKRFILSFYPFDGEEWEKITKSGIMLEPKVGTDGKKFLRIRRPLKKTFDDEVTFFCPPSLNGAVSVHYVNKENGTKVTTYKKGEEIERVGEVQLLGNGTVVVANIAVYDTAKGKGHRLESLKVLDLVVYDPDAPNRSSNDDSKETKKEEAPVAEAAKAEPAKKAKKETVVEEDLNDEIPW